MSGVFRRALATLVALSFLLAQGGNSAAEPRAAYVAHGFSVPAELTAANAGTLTELLARIGPPRAVLAASAPQRVPVKEPPRVRPSMPPAGAVRPKIVTGLRPLNGRHVPGFRMLRPVEIDGAVKAAARRRAPASTIALPVGGGTRTVSKPGAAAARPGTRQAQSLPSAPNGSGTGINPWWRYQEQNVPGGGRVMVNVGTGNLLLQDDDMAVPHKGIALAFRRTYNSQSGHDVRNSDGAGMLAEPAGLYGNGWTNTFDAHLARSVDGSMYYVYDIDGARYDYTPDATSWSLHPAPGNHATLTFDGSCGFLWTKKSGTSYYLYRPNAGVECPTFPSAGGTTGGYAGRLYQIIGRNRNTYITFSYAWDNGDASASGKISQITAQTESGMSATLSFADYYGYRLLQQLTFPDGATSVQYGYDGSGNLAWASRPPNNAAGTRPVQSYGYSPLGSDSVLH